MDAFYAAVEQRDFPQYRGKPLAVGGTGRRGVISTASYEARQFGVRSAMATYMALKKCPDLILVFPRFSAYREVSIQIQNIFHQYTDLVEPLSLDEAFLDVTVNKQNMPSATIIAKRIKQQIFNETHLTASAGVSYCKFLAKIASDYNKPNGLKVVTPQEAEQFIADLPIEKFFGIGAATAKKMHELGIRTGFDLRQHDETFLVRNFGKNGHFFYKIARGIDNREVNPSREQKSVGAEETFDHDISNIDLLHQKIDEIAMRVHKRLLKKNESGRTLTLKVKFENFKVISRSISFDAEFSDFHKIARIGKELLKEVDFEGKKIRLLGLSINNFKQHKVNIPIQLKIDFGFQTPRHFID